LGTVFPSGIWLPERRHGAAKGGEAVEELLLILVVADDQAIQGFLEEALSDGGFETAIACSGEQAMVLLGENDGKYRALVTDIDLGRGNIDGWEIARHAREIDPALPVVTISGDSAGEWTSRGVPDSMMLPKPFASAQLVTALSQLLNSRTPGV
jgi:DNA-binding NtrC family response regulator